MNVHATGLLAAAWSIGLILLITSAVSRHTQKGCQGASEPQSACPPSSSLQTASATHRQPLCYSILPYPDAHARFEHSATMLVPSLPLGLGDTVRAGVYGRHDDMTATQRPHPRAQWGRGNAASAHSASRCLAQGYVSSQEPTHESDDDRFSGQHRFPASQTPTPPTV